MAGGSGENADRWGEQAFPGEPKPDRRTVIRRTGEENRTTWTNGKRIGNLLIKANHTGDSILVRVYISPARPRERWRRPVVPLTRAHCRGTRLSAPPGLASPLPCPSIVPHPTQARFIPGAVSERYKPDRRRSGCGSGFQALAGKSGLSPALNPQTGRRVSPSVPCVQQERRRGRGGLWLLSGRPLLPPGSARSSALDSLACPRALACRGQRRQSQEEKERPACHAALPASPHAAAGFTRVKFKESQQRQLFSLPSSGITVSPSQASSCPLPRSSPSWA